MADPNTNPMDAQRKARSIWLRSGLAVAVAIGVTAVFFLASSILDQVRRFDIDTFDNAPWSLAQIEIEFLAFKAELRAAEPDLREIRRDFDVLYSRVDTVRNAMIFEALRDDRDFQRHLAQIDAFLNDTVELIDGPDDALLAALPAIDAAATETRPATRRMAVIGLDLYVVSIDEQRQAVSLTTAQLGGVIAALFLGLVLAALRLDRLNKQGLERGRVLEQTNTRLNTIVNTAIDGVLVADANFRILDFSPAAETIFGRSAAETLGEDVLAFIDVTAPDMAPLPRTEALAVLLRSKDRIEGTAHRLDRRKVPIEIAFQRALTPMGALHIAFVRDISQRLAAEADLVAARDAALEGERAKSNFVATMSHEIRTPLNGLLGNMDLIRQTPLSDKQARYVANMETSGRMLMRHVSDVLQIAQFDAGKTALQTAPLHLPNFMDEMVASQTAIAQGNRTTLGWDWDGAPVDWIATDADRLQLILINLFGNAVKFTRDGRVAISVRQIPDDAGPILRFDVTDTGPGIAPDQLAHVFDDFFVGNSTLDRNADGSGLGLGIAKRFAAALGGAIGVESTLGEGSRFWFTIPLVLAAPGPTEDGHLSRPDVARPLRILVAEDNDINRAVLTEMLEADGHQVTAVADGARAVEAAEVGTYDLILMDINMPVMDGRAATAAILSGSGPSRQSPIVALTANVLEADRKAFLDLGMVSVLTKPLTRIALRDLLRQIDDLPPAHQPNVSQDQMAETRETLGDARFMEVLSRFQNEAETTVEMLLSEPPDLTALASAAHQTAGMAALFGLTGFASVLRDFETAANAKNMIALRQLGHSLPQIWSDTKAQISAVTATIDGVG